MLGGGLVPGTLAVVYGATGIGKTHLGLTFAEHGSLTDGARGLVFDMNGRGDPQQHDEYAARLFGWTLTPWSHTVTPMADPYPPPGAMESYYSNAFPWVGRTRHFQVESPGGHEFDWNWKAAYNHALYTVRPFFYFHFAAGSRRVVGIAGERPVVAEHRWRDDPVREHVLTGVHVLDDRLAIDRVDDGLTHPPVGEWLDAGVEPVEAHAVHRALHVDMPGILRQARPVGTRWDRRVLEVALPKLVVHRVALVTRKDPEDQARELWRRLEVGRVRGEDQFLAAIPAKEPKRARADRLRAERVAARLHDVPRQDLGLPDREQRDEGGVHGVQHDLDRVPVEDDEPGHRLRLAVCELASAADVHEQVGHARAGLRIEQARQREHDVVRHELSPVVEFHVLAEIEGPRQVVARASPEFRQRRADVDGRIEVHEAVEDLVRDRATVDVADPSRIERLGVVGERSSIGSRGVFEKARDP